MVAGPVGVDRRCTPDDCLGYIDHSFGRSLSRYPRPPLCHPLSGRRPLGAGKSAPPPPVHPVFFRRLNLKNERSGPLGELLESHHHLFNPVTVTDPLLIEVSLCGGQDTGHRLPSYLRRPASIWSVPERGVCVASTGGPPTRPPPPGDASVPDESDGNQPRHESAAFVVEPGQEARQLLLPICSACRMS